MLKITTLAAVLLADQGSGTCRRDLPFQFSVEATHAEISISENFSVDQLEELARGFNRTSPHPIRGFYVGEIGYSATFEPMVPQENSDCSRPVKLHIKIVAINRRIELARELRSRLCMWSAYKEHYKKHADLDDAIVEDAARKANAAVLSNASLMGQDSDVNSPVGATEILNRIHSIVDPIVADAQKTRLASRVQPDTPDEVERLRDACLQSL